ncbi:MAG TPA: arginine deiminase-related protein [Rhodocyclaceae bacterium]|nr:arginine deiminase-related protein [Rhodocyclaceae bacterium]
MRQRLLMCSPEGFDVSYEINPWMKGQVGRIDRGRAAEQWRQLQGLLATVAEVEVMAGDPAWPDLVFTANAGLPLPGEKLFILSNFTHPERRGEKSIDRHWFEERGWRCVDLGPEACFEGAGDALLDSAGRLFIADGLRTNRVAADRIGAYFEGAIQPLGLVDPAFYHLDTCFCPLADGYALCLPSAFAAASRDLLQQSFGDRLIELTAEEGRLFCANAVNVDRLVVMNQVTPRLASMLAAAGFTAIGTPLTEFMKSGGSAKCLTLRLA